MRSRGLRCILRFGTVVLGTVPGITRTPSKGSAMPERKLDIDIARWTVQALARWMLTTAVVLGVFIVIGGAQRFTGAGYAAALRYPYAPESWGYVLTVIGVIGLAASLRGKLRLVALALYAQGAWSIFFASSFAKTASENPAAGTTGPIIYASAAVIAVTLGVAHWKSGQLWRARTT